MQNNNFWGASREMAKRKSLFTNYTLSGSCIYSDAFYISLVDK